MEFLGICVLFSDHNQNQFTVTIQQKVSQRSKCRRPCGWGGCAPAWQPLHTAPLAWKQFLACTCTLLSECASHFSRHNVHLPWHLSSRARTALFWKEPGISGDGSMARSSAGFPARGYRLLNRYRGSAWCSTGQHNMSLVWTRQVTAEPSQGMN
jgi:hypothetical protein